MGLYLRRSFVRLMTATALSAMALSTAAPGQAAELKKLEIIAPANPGGGWDQTARTIQGLLQEAGLASSVQVQNVPGAGGTIGLAQFVTTKKGKGDTLLLAGQTLQGAIITNKAPVTLDQVTPVARLVGEYEIVVVPVDSPIKTLDDLMAKVKADPQSVSWGGGSVGSTDHILAGLMMQAVGADLTKLNYIAHSGGGEALSSILGGHVTAGISGYGEFGPQVDAGKLRALAISADERMPGVDIPTLKEQGLDVSFFNWRGMWAPAGIRNADLEALSTAVETLLASPAWKETLTKRQWVDLAQPAAEFAAFVKDDRTKMEKILTDLGLAK
jgi:putative tricarboxylic transport membrane protein